MRWRLSFTLCLFVISAADAQERPGSGDTLRFLHTVKTTGEMEMPTGAQQMTADMRLLMAMAFVRPDSALVWVDSATMSTVPPTPVQAMIDQLRSGTRVSVRFLADGSVQTSDALAGGLNMSGLQMAGAQLPFILSHRGELRPRTSWTDTTTVKRDTMGINMEMTSITRYEVVGDSVIEGLPVAVLATSTTATTSSAGVSGAGTVQMTGKGQGSGRVYYSRALRLIVLHNASVQMETNTSFGTMSVVARNRADQAVRLVRR
jgi:hypothetical protein